MSFFALGSGVAVAFGATAGGLVATGVGAAAAYGGSKLLNKATSGSSSGSVGSLPNNQIDIDKIISDSRTAAADNYKNSLALEAANNPGQAAFRTAATDAARKLASSPYQASYTGAMPPAAYTGTPQGNALLSESADSILDSLRLGSKLPADVMAQITRTALAKSGQAGLSGSFAGRGLVARDIGTNSLALLTARQQQALNAGSIMDQLGLGRANYGLNAAKFGLDVDRFGLEGAQFDASKTLQLGSLANAMQLPNSGLDPGAIASLYIGQNNALNQTNQNQFLIDQQNANNRNAQLNQLLGFGSSVFANRGKTTVSGAPDAGGYYDIGTLPTTVVKY